MLFEAQWLRLRRLRLALPGLPEALEGFKVLHVSDLHAGAPGPNARAISKFVAAARGARPDMIMFTGDMTDKKKDLGPHLDLLLSLEAPHGKFAVLGNHDHGLRKSVVQDFVGRFLGREGSAGREAASRRDLRETVADNRRLLALARILLLENECSSVDTGGSSIQVCGIDELEHGFADISGTRRQVDPRAGLRVLLSHSPDVVSHLSSGDFNLVLSGHTHGGQICIPHPTRGRVPLSTSGSKYEDGVYRLPGLTLHVSRGVGTTLVPFRLMSRPEVTLLELARA